MATSTNLARQPFRNERLRWLLAAVLIAAAATISAVHGRLINRLLSGDEANVVQAVRENEARIVELESGIAADPPLRIEAAELARLGAFKELVDRRVFPWRRLLAELESTLSEDVRLTTITPQSMRDAKAMRIEVAGQARSKDAAFTLAEALDASPAFSNAALKSLAEDGSEIQFTLEFEFDPAASPNPAPGQKPPSPGVAR